MSKGKGKERATIVLDDEELYEGDEEFDEEEQAKLAKVSTQMPLSCIPRSH